MIAHVTKGKVLGKQAREQSSQKKRIKVYSNGSTANLRRSEVTTCIAYSNTPPQCMKYTG